MCRTTGRSPGCTGGDGTGRFKGDRVRFVRSCVTGSRVYGNLVYVPCRHHAARVCEMIDTC